MTFKKILYSFLVFLFVQQLYSQTADFESQKMASATPPQGMRGTPINLPDISVIGTMDGYVSDDKTDPNRNKFGIEEVELALQSFLYPQIRGDVYLSFHKHNSEFKAEVEEAKVTFLRLFDGVAGMVGKTRIQYGKINPLHPHQWPMVDQPPVLTNFFGDHGFIGEGASLSYLFPLPFFLQLEGGAWRIPAHEHEVEFETVTAIDPDGNPIEVLKAKDEEPTEFGMGDEVYTSRLKASFAPTPKSELELGSSYAQGKGSHFEEHLDRANVAGVDLTFRFWPGAHSKFTFQNEYLRLRREVPPGILHREGFYSYLGYRFNQYFSLGSRWDYAENAFPDRQIERAVSGIVSFYFTETAALRFQYKRRRVENATINEGWTQVVFGMGPHSHALE